MFSPARVSSVDICHWNLPNPSIGIARTTGVLCRWLQDKGRCPLGRGPGLGSELPPGRGEGKSNCQWSRQKPSVGCVSTGPLTPACARAPEPLLCLPQSSCHHKALCTTPHGPQKMHATAVMGLRARGGCAHWDRTGCSTELPSPSSGGRGDRDPHDFLPSSQDPQDLSVQPSWLPSQAETSSDKATRLRVGLTWSHPLDAGHCRVLRWTAGVPRWLCRCIGGPRLPDDRAEAGGDREGGRLRPFVYSDGVTDSTLRPVSTPRRIPHLETAPGHCVPWGQQGRAPTGPCPRQNSPPAQHSPASAG